MVILQGYVEVHSYFYKALIKFTYDKVCDLAPWPQLALKWLRKTDNTLCVYIKRKW